MAAYRETASVSIIARQSTEDADAMRYLNEYASLRDEPVTASLKKLLRGVLPQKIAELKRQVKATPAGEAA